MSKREESIVVRITPEELAAVDEVARRMGSKRSEAVRQLISGGLSQLQTGGTVLLVDPKPSNGTEAANRTAHGPCEAIADVIDQFVDAAVYWKDRSGRIVRANHRACEWYGPQIEGQLERNCFRSLEHLGDNLERGLWSGQEKIVVTREFRVSNKGSLQCTKTIRMRWDEDPALDWIAVFILPLSLEEKGRWFNEFFEQRPAESFVPDGGVYVLTFKHGDPGTYYFEDKCRELTAAHRVSPRNRSHARLEKAGSAFSKSRLFEHSPASNVYCLDKMRVEQLLQKLKVQPPGYYEAIDFRLWEGKHTYNWYRAHCFVRTLSPGSRMVCIAHELLHRGSLTDKVAHAFLDAFPGYVFVKDRQGRFLYINKKLLSDLGKTLRDACGKTDMQLGFLPKQAEFFGRCDEEVIRHNQWQLIPAEILTLPETSKTPTLKRELITIKIPIRGIILEPNAPTDDEFHILGISLSSTEEWRKMDENSRLWVALMDYSVDAIYVKDAALRYRHASRSFCKLLGITDPKTIRGKTAREVWGMTNMHLVAGMEAADSKVIQEGFYIDENPRVTHVPDQADEKRITVKIKLEDRERGFWGILGISRKITELELRRKEK